jgi:SAM-dependent methyltransferase
MELEEQRNLYREMNRVWARNWRWGFELTPSEKHIFDTHIKVGPILNAGCRIGRAFAYFERRGIEIIGIDNEPEMLERAKERAHIAELIQGELNELEVIFPPDTFSSVIILENAFAGLFSEEERTAFLDGVKKVLHPDGQLLVDCIFADSEGSNNYGTDIRVDNRYKDGGYGIAFKETGDAGKVQCYQYFLSDTEFTTVLSDNGFSFKLFTIERQFELAMAVCKIA